jgi:hypothetical protein
MLNPTPQKDTGSVGIGNPRPVDGEFLPVRQQKKKQSNRKK